MKLLLIATKHNFWTRKAQPTGLLNLRTRTGYSVNLKAPNNPSTQDVQQTNTNDKDKSRLNGLKAGVW